MRIRSIILCILLACAIGISIPLYRLYTQEEITKQEAYEIGKKVFLETTADESAIIVISDAVDVWYLHAFCTEEERQGYAEDYYLEISKRTGKVVKIGYDHKFTEVKSYGE